MLKTKCAGMLLPFVLALSWPGTVSAMPDGLPVSKTPNYKTVQAVRGSYIEAQSASALEYYPNRAALRYTGDENARFVEYPVKKGDAVKKDDVVAILICDSSASDFESVKIAHKRALEDFAEGKDGWEKNMTSAQKAFAAATGEYGRQIQQTRIDKLRLEYRLYCHEQERSIALLQKALDEQAKKRAPIQLRAPFSGVIESTELKKTNDIVLKNETLVTMYNQDGGLINIDDSLGNFRYHAPVTVETGAANERLSLSGKVVGSDDILPQELHTGRALIRLDSSADSIILQKISVAVESKRVDGVILVPRNALKMENGKFFVNKLTDGAIQKRFVILGGYNSQEAWIAVGLEEGETVVVD